MHQICSDQSEAIDRHGLGTIPSCLMTRLRYVLGPLAAVCLLCQVGTMALVPVVLWMSPADSHAVCTCGHGPEMTCPMHHGPQKGSEDCVIQAANGPAAAMLTAIVSITGIIPDSTSSILPATSSIGVRSADLRPSGERPVPPDPPPPRA